MPARPPGRPAPLLVPRPDLPGADLPAVGDDLAKTFPRCPQHGLPEAHPLSVVLLIGMGVVAFRAVAHREHEVSQVGGLAPGRRERDETAHLVLVGERLHPRQPVRVGPDRVVDANEVGVEPAPAFEQEVRQQE